jgi:hypothetical protein
MAGICSLRGAGFDHQDTNAANSGGWPFSFELDVDEVSPWN